MLSGCSLNSNNSQNSSKRFSQFSNINIINKPNVTIKAFCHKKQIINASEFY